MALTLATSVRNAMADAITTEVGGSSLLRIYGGVRPANGGAATTLLAELTCNVTFAPAAAGGVLTLNAVTADSVADNSGTATWFRILTSGSVQKIDGSAGGPASGADLELDNASIVAGGTVSMSTPRTITVAGA